MRDIDEAPPAPEATDWLGRAQQIQPETVALRRAIHADPELGLHLPKTTAKVEAALAGLPLELRRGPSSTGILAVLEGGRPGRTVLLRGDMDALPMPEDTGLPYSSQTPNTMHACGHDTHTAMLVGAARLLAERREALEGRVYFMFQPGEEGHFGARHMIADGLLDPLPDAAFALHVFPNAAAGVIGTRPGPILASDDTFHITVRGRGGHASMPHDTCDPVPIACEIVTALHAMVTRRVSVFDPAVVTVGRVSAGTTHNVIPEHAEIEGTMRSLSEETRSLLRERLEALATHIAAAHGAEADLRIDAGFPVTINDARAAELVKQTTIELFGEEAWLPLPNPIMGAEDFSYVLQKVPGAMAFLGAAPPGCTDPRQACPCHSNKMVLDESVMVRGVALHCALAEGFLSRGYS